MKIVRTKDPKREARVVEGIIFGTVVQFVDPHPTIEGKYIPTKFYSESSKPNYYQDGYWIIVDDFLDPDMHKDNFCMIVNLDNGKLYRVPYGTKFYKAENAALVIGDPDG